MRKTILFAFIAAGRAQSASGDAGVAPSELVVSTPTVQSF
jgi:hypothetical protein